MIYQQLLTSHLIPHHIIALHNMIAKLQIYEGRTVYCEIYFDFLKPLFSFNQYDHNKPEKYNYRSVPINSIWPMVPLWAIMLLRQPQLVMRSSPYIYTFLVPAGKLGKIINFRHKVVLPLTCASNKRLILRCD